jgi:hypothetical protein
VPAADAVAALRAMHYACCECAALRLSARMSGLTEAEQRRESSIDEPGVAHEAYFETGVRRAWMGGV